MPRVQTQHQRGRDRHKLIRTIGQVRATTPTVMMAIRYKLTRLARFLDDGVDAFYKRKPSETAVRLLVRLREKWAERA